MSYIYSAVISTLSGRLEHLLCQNIRKNTETPFENEKKSCNAKTNHNSQDTFWCLH